MFSVVIPTYNRAEILKRSLARLLKIDGIEHCEVIVVNDGSTDSTASVLEAYREESAGLVKIVSIQNGGPAPARNVGVRIARHEYILFMDDDVFPHQNMLQNHWRLLQRGYAGSQGVLKWHREIENSPLLRYIDSRGSQFAFDKVKDPGDLNYRYVYTANFAAARDLVLNAGGFDESLFIRKLSFSAFEDTILGYKLQKNGARLSLNRDALADHLHPMNEENFLERERKVGYCVGRLIKHHPEIARSLNLKNKDLITESQVRMLQIATRAWWMKCVAPYALQMRIRHREAFYRGVLQFAAENANKSG